MENIVAAVCVLERLFGVPLLADQPFQDAERRFRREIVVDQSGTQRVFALLASERRVGGGLVNEVPPRDAVDCRMAEPDAVQPLDGQFLKAVAVAPAADDFALRAVQPRNGIASVPEFRLYQCPLFKHPTQHFPTDLHLGTCIAVIRIAFSRPTTPCTDPLQESPDSDFGGSD